MGSPVENSRHWHSCRRKLPQKKGLQKNLKITNVFPLLFKNADGGVHKKRHVLQTDEEKTDTLYREWKGARPTLIRVQKKGGLVKTRGCKQPVNVLWVLRTSTKGN